ncbi:pyridoxamine 5'-phosphate oxidase family protein [Campylobacter fetus]|uniref:Pyridoxamine 5'-phosphate oxidase putative domain-containing protein n=1 Tax=Campylobacter fetus subsp. testudinum TaxID=1507806 RepID=A0AAX0HDP3_CAMFE|nr:pyridoxamine 5'-phosphate oxidase family protein [Campylobacter fetus]AGZ82103.1 putative protein, pyridoxine 5'-phosphate oxidase family [Campylobacter fetus subsp. testudinum 03-427]AJB45829.1 hypothetical protein CR44_06295 [Campylobacter fetus subsp. testudinum]ALV65271.1 hypothetical protein, pyridoxine 5'-phosphate oxidase family [Campylobacter fetus subsp. testudinum Sp3]AVK81523.1 hypothetical protein C6B32_06720 [Campylobacter fetus subsp. testudinum]EAI4321974.1 hypothetical prote
MDENISKFLDKIHILTLGVISDGFPHLCSCFYAYDPDLNSFIVASKSSSKHIQSIKNQPNVAINIALDTKIVGKIEGVQANGVMGILDDERLEKLYFKRFPYAKLLNPELYVIRVDYIKYTNNRLGFGKKIVWQRD